MILGQKIAYVVKLDPMTLEKVSQVLILTWLLGLSVRSYLVLSDRLG